MTAKQKAALFATILVVLYGLISYLLFTYYATSLLTTIITIPLSLAFIVGYGMGDFVGYLSLAMMIVLIWFGCYLIFKGRKKNKSSR